MSCDDHKHDAQEFLDVGMGAKIKENALHIWCSYCEKDIIVPLNKFWRKAIKKERIFIFE